MVREFRLLKALDHAEDVEQRYGFHRIVVLVSGPDASRLDDLIVELGAVGVRYVLRQDFHEDVPAWSTDEVFAERVLRCAVELTSSRRIGKTAICASGGGITGIYYEMGVLKCLDDCLTNCGVNDFDMMFGISAGAVVTSLLSVGYTPDELIAGIAGVPGGRVPPLSLSLLRLSHFNHADMRWRMTSAAKTGLRAFWDTLRGRGGDTAEKLFLEYTSLVGAPFHSSEFEVILRRILQMSGSTESCRSSSTLARPIKTPDHTSYSAPTATTTCRSARLSKPRSASTPPSHPCRSKAVTTKTARLREPPTSSRPSNETRPWSSRWTRSFRTCQSYRASHIGEASSTTSTKTSGRFRSLVSSGRATPPYAKTPR
jgi:hypothetical protein